jgi:hypothetical protein
MSLLANIVLEKSKNAALNNLSPIIHHFSNNHEAHPTFLQVIDELCKDDNIRMMIYATICKRPALEPVIYKVEAICQHRRDFDIFSDDTAKQSLGVIVKIIMDIYGYTPISDEPTPILKSNNMDILSKSINNAQIYKLKL